MTNDLDTIASSHFFHYTMAGQALCDMHRYAFDLDSKEFDLALERFNLARSRALGEFKRFNELLECNTDSTDFEQNEETGQP